MSVPTCIVRAVVNDSVGGEPIEGARVTAALSSYEVYQGYVVPHMVEALTNAAGEAFLELWPNELGSVESYYTIKIIGNGKTLRTTAVIPNLPAIDLHTVASLPPYDGMPDGALVLAKVVEALTQSLAARDASAVSAASADSSATAAAGSAAASSGSATAAADSASTADAKASEASTSAASALASRNTALTAATNAGASAMAAGASEANAAASAATAGTAATNASASATDAAASASTATTKAGEAITAATGAAASAATATAKANDAAASASEALASEQAAETSKTSAVTSASTAATKAGEASASAAAAAGSATTAGTKSAESAASASSALASRNAAATSATNAAASATTAATKAGEASTSAGTASTKAGEAAASAAEALGYRNNAQAIADAIEAGAVTSVAGRTGDVVLAKADVGLNAVDNLSRAQILANPAITGTPTGLTKTHVGLPNVDNTSDANKPVSTAQATADGLRVLKAGDTMTGNLTIAKASPVVILNKAASGQGAPIYGQTNGVPRWAVSLGGGDPETGSNAGSNFYITRFADNGNSLGDPLLINRATGSAIFQSGLTVNGGFNVSTAMSALGYYAQGYGAYMLQATSAQNNGSNGVGNNLSVYALNAGAGLGLAANIEIQHNQGINARFVYVISGTSFEMRDNGTGYSAGGWVATSDQRVKTNREIIDNPLARNRRLTGYVHDRADMIGLDGVTPRKVGPLAQDALHPDALPWSVIVPPGYDRETDTGPLLAMYPDGIPSLHIECIKALEDIVSELRAEVATLRERVHTLEG